MDLPDPKQAGRLYEIAQVGFEMAAPIGIGLALDYYFEWAPWGIIIGAVLGLVLGLYHLVVLANRQNRDRQGKRDGPT